jgi:hypothetical protein
VRSRFVADYSGNHEDFLQYTVVIFVIAVEIRAPALTSSNP